MQELITSFLVQTKECSLPGIGKFRIVTTPAELDVANKRIFPPTDEILFTGNAGNHLEELVKYIAHKKNITEKEAEETFKNWCVSIKEKLDSGEKINFESVGSLKKNGSGNIFLHSQKPLNLFEPVTAERVIHKNEEHAMLVGDRETTSSVMNQFLHEEEIVKKSNWKIIAAILLAIALVILFIHFYRNGMTFPATGNQLQHSPEAPSATYSPK